MLAWEVRLSSGPGPREEPASTSSHTRLSHRLTQKQSLALASQGMNLSALNTKLEQTAQ